MSFDKKLASYIDHTLLSPDVTPAELSKACKVAKQHHFAGVCVNACNIPFIAEQLQGADVKPVTVVGFPLGASSPQAKAFEAKDAIENGVLEIDMVINIGALKAKDYTTVYQDISVVVRASSPHIVKVIIETGLLRRDEKIAAAVLSKAAGEAFVKTSTGFGPGGATIEDIRLIRQVIGDDMHIKASGGIRTKTDAIKMIEAGADRIGTSKGPEIIHD